MRRSEELRASTAKVAALGTALNDVRERFYALGDAVNAAVEAAGPLAVSGQLCSRCSETVKLPADVHAALARLADVLVAVK